MYYDLFINYENQLSNLTREKYNDFCELLTSAICDNYSILTTTTTRKGTVQANDLNTYKEKEIDPKLIFQTYSLKFLNSARINPILIDWNNIKILNRLNIEVSDAKDLYQFSNPNAALKSYEILSVAPKNEKVFDSCLIDLNCDIISLTLDEKFNFSIKKHLILSAIDKNVFFEILYTGFIKDQTKRSIFIANVLMLLEVTKGKNVIISSGAENYFDHRSPYDIITIFETIFEIDTETVKKMLSENCERVVLKSVQRKYFKTVIDLQVEEKEMNTGMIIES
jgi:RNase P/RNase MRP subunit p30